MLRDYSYWEQDAFGGTWDVSIVGGGITGLSTGISLLERRPDLKVVIVDRGFLPIGASTRNAGFACFGSPSEVLEDIGKMGEQQAMDLVRSRYLGLRKLLARIPPAIMDYRPCGGYEVFADGEDAGILDRLPYLNGLLGDALGLRDVYRKVAVPPGLRGFSTAVFNPFEGQLHAGKMIKALRAMYTAAGGHVWTGPDIREIEETPDGARLHGALMLPVEARQVVVTTNAFAARLLPALEVHGARNHVLVTKPIPGLALDGTFHYDRGYVYFRNIGDRILLGGARNRDLDAEMTEEFGSNPIIVDALDTFLHDHLAIPAAGLVEYRWSGIIGIGPEKSPIIRRVSPHVIAGVRLSGMGVALASLIGDTLCEDVLVHLEPSSP
jgi:gamma-glutamylputrescine oxidase